MKVRAASSWTTRLLFVGAFVVAGLIAWYQVNERQTVREASETDAAAQAPEEPSGDLVEVEIVSPE